MKLLSVYSQLHVTDLFYSYREVKTSEKHLGKFVKKKKVTDTVSRKVCSSFGDVWAIDRNSSTGQSLGYMQYSNLFFTTQKVK